MLKLNVGFGVLGELVLFEVVLLANSVNMILTVFVKPMILFVSRAPRPPLVARLAGLRGRLFNRLLQIKHIVKVVGSQSTMYPHDLLALFFAGVPVRVFTCRIHSIDVLVNLTGHSVMSVMRIVPRVQRCSVPCLHLGWMPLRHSTCQFIFRSSRGLSH